MAKIAVDLMGEEFKEGSVEYFTIPGPGICINIKTDRSEVEIDIPKGIYEQLMEDLKSPQVKR